MKIFIALGGIFLAACGILLFRYFRNNKDKEQSYIIVNPRVYYGGNFDIEGGVSGILKWFKNKNKSKIKQTI